MRLPFLLCCLALTTQAAAAQRLPLIVLEHSSLSDKPPLPLIIIGALPEKSLSELPDLPQRFTSGEQPRWDTFPDNNHDTLDAIAGGKIKFTGPIAGRTVLFLAAPFLDIRQSWLPTAVTLDDNRVTLEVTAWDGDTNTDTGKSGKCRAAYLISLAALPHGDYIFHIHCTHRAEQFDHRYLPSQNDDASTPFTISVPIGKELAPTAIVESALKLTPIIQKDMLPEFIPPIHWARDDSLAELKGPTFQVGTLDAYKFMDNFQDTARLAPPHLQTSSTAEYAGEHLVALINPHSESGDFIQLGDIEFHGQEIVINAEYWQDMTPRAAVVPQSPFILIPFNSIPKGSHKITLIWREYQGQTLISPTPYTESPPGDDFKPATITFAIK